MAIRHSLFVSLFSLSLALPAYAQNANAPADAKIPSPELAKPELAKPELAKPAAPLPGVVLAPGMTAAGPLDAASAGAAKLAAPADQDWGNDEASYDACMDLARAHPEDGLDAASRWHDRGGGEPAEHCAAEAMMGLKQYDAAARRLEALAADMADEDAAAAKAALAAAKTAKKAHGHKPPLPQGRPGLRAAVLAQAADAWNDSGDPRRALDDIGAALKLAPGDAGLYGIRARFEAALGDYRPAQSDLARALKGSDRNAALYAAKAAADRYLGEIKPALRDAGQAVKLDPTLPEGWLERGNARRLAGDAGGARKDWMQVLSLAPDSSAADAVRDNLARVDVHLPGEKAAALKPADLQPCPVAGTAVPAESGSR